MWECPSIQAATFAEWIYHSTEYDTIKSLMATHATSIAESGMIKHQQAKSLVQGILAIIETRQYLGFLNLDKSQYFSIGADQSGIELVKVNVPGSWLPRILEISGSRSSKSFGARFRSENLENVIINAIYPLEENILTNSADENDVAVKLGLKALPRFTVDVTVGDNDIYSVTDDHVNEAIEHFKNQIEEIEQMSFYEKIKAAMGYSNAGFLKYFNNEPVDYQKEWVADSSQLVLPTSLGEVMIVNSNKVAFIRVKAEGTLSALGFRGKLAPQMSIQENKEIILTDFNLKNKKEITANLNSDIAADYTH